MRRRLRLQYGPGEGPPVGRRGGVSNTAAGAPVGPGGKRGLLPGSGRERTLAHPISANGPRLGLLLLAMPSRRSVFVVCHTPHHTQKYELHTALQRPVQDRPASEFESERVCCRLQRQPQLAIRCFCVVLCRFPRRIHCLFCFACPASFGPLGPFRSVIAGSVLCTCSVGNKNRENNGWAPNPSRCKNKSNTPKKPTPDVTNAEIQCPLEPPFGGMVELVRF